MKMVLAMISTWLPYFLGILGMLCVFTGLLARKWHRYLSGILSIIGGLLVIADLLIRHLKLSN